MAFFVVFTVGTGNDPVNINLEQVTRVTGGVRGNHSVIHLADGKEVTVNENFDAVKAQCEDAGRRA